MPAGGKGVGRNQKETAPGPTEARGDRVNIGGGEILGEGKKEKERKKMSL